MPRQVSVPKDKPLKALDLPEGVGRNGKAFPMEARGMVAWIKRHVPPEYRPNQSPLEAACWFCAYQEATEVADFSTREVAHMLQHGTPGYKRLCDIDSYIDGYETRDDLIATMYDFWKTGETEG